MDVPFFFQEYLTNPQYQSAVRRLRPTELLFAGLHRAFSFRALSPLSFQERKFRIAIPDKVPLLRFISPFYRLFPQNFYKLLIRISTQQ